MERKRKIVCGKCQQSCVSTMCISCEKCDKEFHAHCEGLSQSKMSELKSLPYGFICTDCCSVWGLFDFRASQQRLSDAAKINFECLKDAVDREAILLRGVKPFQIERKAVSPGELDQITNEFIRRSGGIRGRTAVKVDGDGNCLFHALSYASYGDQSKSKEIKVWTCMEMVKNREYYKRLNKNSLFADLCGKYEEECMKCAIDGKYSSGYMLQASASALGLTVTSVYPSLNGLLDKYKAELNRSFYPRQGKSLKEVFIMWTSTYTYNLFSAKEWIPNHFCPLIETEPYQSHTVLKPISVENFQTDKRQCEEKENINSEKGPKNPMSTSTAERNRQNKRQRTENESLSSIKNNLNIGDIPEVNIIPQRPSLSVSPIQTGQSSLLRSFADDEYNLNSTPVSLPNSSLFEDEIMFTPISPTFPHIKWGLRGALIALTRLFYRSKGGSSAAFFLYILYISKFILCAFLTC